MRALLWLLTLGALAVGLALAAHYNDGYALFVLPPWRIEVSLNLLVLLTIGGFLFGYLVLRGVFLTLGLPARVRAFRAARRSKKAEGALREGVLFWLGGRYARSLANAELAWKANHAPGLAALVALGAAHALRDEQKVIEWRQRATVHDEEIHGARLLLEAELAVESRNFTEALVLLNQIEHQSGRHIVAMRLALRAHRAVGHWDEVVHLARQLRKHRALTDIQAAPLIAGAHRERLQSLVNDGHSLANYWDRVPESERQAPGLALEAARCMLKAGEHGPAQQVIEDGLDEEWSSALVALYGDCVGGDVLGRIARAEAWLLAHPRDAALLLVLGRLCLEKQLWGKAQSYFEASLSLQESRGAHIALAKLLDRMEQSELANKHYRAAVLLP
ncbi:MAG: heme biosynthesis protein HemY [Rhodocyclaceae bacterium]|nr:heme biosynthesis protein HemY [Rhodocyclaceae bacterium]